MLECLYTKDSTTYGTVRVHNCAYDKRVFARVTEDEWTSSYDIQAWHSMNYPDDNTDTFTFEIRLGKYHAANAQVPKQIYFAICLQAMYQEFWDNNLGWNFCLDLVERYVLRAVDVSGGVAHRTDLSFMESRYDMACH